jgi:hypothetical protein
MTGKATKKSTNYYRNSILKLPAVFKGQKPTFLEELMLAAAWAVFFVHRKLHARGQALCCLDHPGRANF